ncbi:MAG TPA: NAD(P)-dependent oxidoreductase, partial [Chloroflexota bacterium]|nr:NAD(P)-dependent oxidoreductase [Chloroflexota bacterium]
KQLNAGKLRGAVVDVCYQEPLPPTAPLRHVNNLLITPHISSDPADYVTPTVEVIANNLLRLLSGQELVCRVDATRGY